MLLVPMEGGAAAAGEATIRKGLKGFKEEPQPQARRQSERK
jgi:hypothetical protein